jgi:hypothetical protein
MATDNVAHDQDTDGVGAVSEGRHVRLLRAGIIKLADRCGEALAAAHDDQATVAQLAENIADINLLVWRLRWEGATDGEETGDSGVWRTAAPSGTEAAEADGEDEKP